MTIKHPKVTLLSWTGDPLATVYSLWMSSKNELDLVTPQEARRRIKAGDVALKQEVQTVFRAVIAQHIPVGESIDFVFMIENVSVSWREQAVRHRIGVKPSLERLGIDMGMVDVQTVPDLAESVFWSQSMRIQNMGKFAENEAYRVPESILQHEDSERLLALYRSGMKEVQDIYNELVGFGIPMEDARELIPLGAQHRISWKLNISSLQHIVGKRGCFILQLGIWGPVIEGMIRELVEKVDPIFAELVTPPCLKGDKFTGCVYHEENRRRYTGDDALPPCPLHLSKHKLPEKLAENGVIGEGESIENLCVAFARDSRRLDKAGIPMVSEMHERAEQYRIFWNRDPYTGVRLPIVK